MTKQVEHLTVKCLQQAEKLSTVVFISYTSSYRLATYLVTTFVGRVAVEGH